MPAVRQTAKETGPARRSPEDWSGPRPNRNSSGLSGITASGYRGLGDSGYIPLITINNMYQYVENVTYVLGAHSIKIGGDLRRRQLTPFQSASPKAAFSFDANLTNDPSGATSGSGNTIASMLLGYPASTTRNKYLIWPGLRLWEMAGYLQDDWRATSWLTLNLGLRWDYYGPITEVANRIANVDLAAGKIITAGENGVSASAGVKSDWRDFAPRVGFAATFAKGTVLRGGYGINYVPPFIGSPLAFRNPPFVTLYKVTATALNPITKISDPLPSAVATDPAKPTGSLNGVAFDGTTPYVQQYNLTLQRELPLSFVLTATYAGALGRHQYIFNGAVNLNQPPPGPGAINPRRPYYSLWPNVSGISIAGPWYNTNYHAMQTSLERRYQNGLSVLATYTWAHGIDNFVAMVNDTKRERGNSYLDMRHRFTLMASYDLPFARNSKGAAAAIGRGWRINAITVVATGLPFNISNSSARANTGTGDRPNVVCDPTENWTPTLASWFNTACFQAQPLYTFGNVARNFMHGPTRKQLDISIHREFQPAERLRIQFRAEAFNVTNTPAFGSPGGALGSSSFGVISSAGAPRNLQFDLKLLFYIHPINCRPPRGCGAPCRMSHLMANQLSIFPRKSYPWQISRPRSLGFNIMRRRDLPPLLHSGRALPCYGKPGMSRTIDFNNRG
jgi:hypothetical protein